MSGQQDVTPLLHYWRDQLQSHYQHVSSKTKHREGKGTTRERRFAEFLNSMLLPRFRTLKGEIFDSTGACSPQCDCIVVDSTSLPPYMIADEPCRVPTEAVWAIVESKTKLTGPELQTCLENASEIKHMWRIAPHLDLREPHRPHLQPQLSSVMFPPVYCVFAHEANQDENGLLRRFHDTWAAEMEDMKNHPKQRWVSVPDIILCIKRDWLLCWEDEQASSLHLVWAADRVPVVVKGTGLAFVTAWALLYEWLQDAVSTTIPLIAYTEGAIDRSAVMRLT
ncbi:MAG: DUF6602 domain-containing protein [Armatimonadota bacterium]